MDVLNTVDQIQEALENLGYETKTHNGSIHTVVGKFPAVLTIDENVLTISCRMASLGDFQEDKVPELLFACLDANSRIKPFAWEIITASDHPDLDDPAEFPLNFSDSVPLGDLSFEELNKAMESLWRAVADSTEVLHIGLD